MGGRVGGLVKGCRAFSSTPLPPSRNRRRNAATPIRSTSSTAKTTTPAASGRWRGAQRAATARKRRACVAAAASSSDEFSTTSSAASGSAGTQTAASMRLVGGVRDLVDEYDIFLLDMWGVMHDGSRPYDGVLDVIGKLKDAGKEMVILSNSSKRRSNSHRMLAKLGFDPRDFGNIITSGEVAYRMLAAAGNGNDGGDDDDDVAPWLGCEPWDVLADLQQRSGDTDRKVFVYGSGDGDEEYCESCGWSLAPLDEARLIVARGTFTVNDGGSSINKRQDPERYEAMLRETLQIAAKKRLPMIVCNPDKIRPDAERPPMPGKIGDMYETALVDSNREDGAGEVRCSPAEAEALVKRIGKPFRDVYDIAMNPAFSTGGGSLPRACMVGDALETDVAGGSAYGIDTVWVVRDGIHGPELPPASASSPELLAEGAESILRSFNRLEGTYAKGRQLLPTYIMPTFKW